MFGRLSGNPRDVVLALEEVIVSTDLEEDPLCAHCVLGARDPARTLGAFPS